MIASPQQTAQSLFVVYRQLPAETREVFRQLIDNETINEFDSADYLPLTEPTLKGIWEAPEENYWDELYAKQHPTT
jgi:hypothetical protein